MKSSGIVRRIDDLGRIVIPKAVRKACGLEEYDPMEIFYDENSGEITLKKYVPMDDENEGDKKMKISRFFNLCNLVANHIHEENEQAVKFANNRRCKRPNYGVIASILNDPSIGIEFEDGKVTEEIVREWADSRHWY